jgi:hypothetical protein
MHGCKSVANFYCIICFTKRLSFRHKKSVSLTSDFLNTNKHILLNIKCFESTSSKRCGLDRRNGFLLEQNLNYFLDQTFRGAINRLTRKLKNGKKKKKLQFSKYTTS